MSATLAEKIIARAAGRDTVSPGEIVTCAVDLAMMHDSGGPRRVKPILERLNAKIWDVEKVVVIMDHNAKNGSAKFLHQCNLPLTGSHVVDLLISDLGVFEFHNHQATLIELAPGVTVNEVRERSEAEFYVHSSLQ